jgi:hypothetical protein
LDTENDYLGYFELSAAKCWIKEDGGMDRLKYYQPYEGV